MSGNCVRLLHAVPKLVSMHFPPVVVGAPDEFDRLVSAEVADYSLANFKSYEDAAGVISGVAATKTPMSDASVGRGRRSGMLSSHKRGRCIWKCSMELSGRQD